MANTTQEILQRTLTRNSERSLGQMGAINHTRSQLTTALPIPYTDEQFFAVQFITDCTPIVLECEDGENFNEFNFKAGDIVYLNVTSLHTSAGEEVILYKA
jgi:hypothetical protein